MDLEHRMSTGPAGEDELASRDRQIVDRLARGETDPVAELYDRYGGVAYSLIVQIVGDRALAEDLLQEVFVRVWKSAAGYRHEAGSVRSWLLAMAHHRAVDEWRRRRERGWLSQEEATEDGLPAAHDAAGDPSLSQALAELPAEQQQVIEMAYFRGFTVAEIAERLGLASGMVQSRTRLGMTKLRARLGVSEGRER